MSSAESKSLKLLRGIVDAGRPLAYIKTAEEHRIGQLLRTAAHNFFATPVPVWHWTLTEGLKRDQEAHGQPLSPRAVLDFIAEHEGAGIFHLKDFHEPLRDAADAPELRRRLRDLYAVCFDRKKYVVITSPVNFVPPELERNLAYIELGVPDLIELDDFLRAETAAINAAGGKAATDPDTLTQIARALQGLTLDESRHAIRRALASGLGLGLESLPILYEEKRLLVNRSGMIQYIGDGGDIDNVAAWRS